MQCDWQSGVCVLGESSDEQMTCHGSVSQETVPCKCQTVKMRPMTPSVSIVSLWYNQDMDRLVECHMKICLLTTAKIDLLDCCVSQRRRNVVRAPVVKILLVSTDQVQKDEDHCNLGIQQSEVHASCRGEPGLPDSSMFAIPSEPLALQLQ